MIKLSSPWNRRIDRFWAPVYDRLFDRLFLAPGRRRAMAVLAPQSTTGETGDWSMAYNGLNQ